MGKVLIRKGSIITSVMGRPIEGNEDKTEEQQHVQLLQRCRLSKHTHICYISSFLYLFTTNYPPLHSSGVLYPSILFQKNNRVNCVLRWCSVGSQNVHVHSPSLRRIMWNRSFGRLLSSVSQDVFLVFSFTSPGMHFWCLFSSSFLVSSPLGLRKGSSGALTLPGDHLSWEWQREQTKNSHAESFEDWFVS